MKRVLFSLIVPSIIGVIINLIANEIIAIIVTGMLIIILLDFTTINFSKSLKNDRKKELVIFLIIVFIIYSNLLVLSLIFDVHITNNLKEETIMQSILSSLGGIYLYACFFKKHLLSGLLKSIIYN